MEGMFCGWGCGEEEEGRATGDGLGGGHAGVEAVCSGEWVDFEEGAVAGRTFEDRAWGGWRWWGGLFCAVTQGSGWSGWICVWGEGSFPEDGLETELGDDEEGITLGCAAMGSRGGHEGGLVGRLCGALDGEGWGLNEGLNEGRSWGGEPGGVAAEEYAGCDGGGELGARGFEGGEGEGDIDCDAGACSFNKGRVG